VQTRLTPTARTLDHHLALRLCPLAASQADHIASFDRLVEEAKALSPRALLTNSHSGCDVWSLDTAVEFFEHALKVEESLGIMICHETHRGRVLVSH
jgi:hypothetical protein